jgi:YVTN family beta-propeller protein
MVEFRILGPLQVLREGRPVALEAPKQRTLLAVLLLHANEVVSTERLVDELWGDRPPATAVKTLQVYVSQLRKTLGGNTIVTRGHGYRAQVAEDELDASRFRYLLAEARRLRAQQRTADAASTYEHTLNLWRGEALSDVELESNGRREAESLDDLRLAAAEEWIDCELALGRHAEVIGELERLVARYPYRERLREQLLLALYRSGRQAEALAAYRDARRALVDELGLEPTRRLQELERAILRQDPALDAPAGADASEPERAERRTRRRLALVGIVAGVVIAIAAAAVVTMRDSPAASKAPVTLAGNSVVIVDPATNAVVGEIPIGGRPRGIAVAAGSVWVANRDDKTLLRIDPSTQQVVRTIGLGAAPADITAGNGDVWVALDDEEVLRVDPGINDVVARIRVAEGKNFCCYRRIKFGGSAVWVSGGGALWRIDAATHEVTRVRNADVYAIDYGDHALWAITGVEANRIERIDPRTTAVIERFRFDRVGRTRSLGGLGFGAGALWSGASGDTTIWKIDPVTGRVIGTFDVGHTVWVTFDEKTVWVFTNERQLVRVDAASLRAVATIPLGVYPSRMIVAGGAVWLSALSP